MQSTTINKTIVSIGIQTAIMTAVVFVMLYFMTRNIPYLQWLPWVCFIPGLIYFSLSILAKTTEKKFNAILKKQNGKCRDCRTPIIEMSDQTWLIKDKIYCLKCGEKHDH